MPSHSHAMSYAKIQGALSGTITATKAGSGTGSSGVLNWQNGYELRIELGSMGFVAAEPHIAADHTHENTPTGSSQSHNNMQPWASVHMWKRIA